MPFKNNLKSFLKSSKKKKQKQKRKKRKNLKTKGKTIFFLNRICISYVKKKTNLGNTKLSLT